MCVNNLSKVAFDSAAAGIEPATSSRKSNALTTAPPSQSETLSLSPIIQEISGSADERERKLSFSGSCFDRSQNRSVLNYFKAKQSKVVKKRVKAEASIPIKWIWNNETKNR